MQGLYKVLSITYIMGLKSVDPLASVESRQSSLDFSGKAEFLRIGGNSHEYRAIRIVVAKPPSVPKGESQLTILETTVEP